MNEIYSTDLADWFVQHVEIVPYISIESIDPKKRVKTWKKIQQKNKKELSTKLRSILYEQLDQLAPLPYKHEKKPGHLGGKSALDYHRIRWVEKKIAKIRQKRFDVFSRNIADLLYLIESEHGLPDEIIISVDEHKLMEDVADDSPKVKAFLTHIENMKSNIRYDERQLSSVIEQKKLFHEILAVMTKEYDYSESFLQPNPLQDRFEMIFEYEEFPLSKKLQTACETYDKNNPQIFIKTLIRIVYSTLQYFGYDKNSDDGNVLLLLVFRYAFDKLYGMNKSPLNREKFDTSRLAYLDPISRYLYNCTFADIMPPNEYCPEHQNTDRVTDIFRNDPYYQTAISYLEELQFYTNPMDSLNCVRLSLMGIESAANHYFKSGEAMLPFEVTFGLFLCVASASQVPELQNFSDFIDECAPESGLAPYFDFSHTKLSAATSHLRKIISNIDKLNHETNNVSS